MQNGNQTETCPDCKGTFLLFSENARGWNTRPHKQCITCYRTQTSKRRASQQCRENSPQCPSANATGSTTPAGNGAIFAQISSIQESCCQNSALQKRHGRSQPGTCRTPDAQISTHHVFTKGHWHRSRFMDHPKLQLHMSIHAADYMAFNKRCPPIKPSTITVMADTGAQSCLWSIDDFLTAGFTNEDLIPVKLDLHAANRSPIYVNGVNILHLQGMPPRDNKQSCNTMLYVSSSLHGFYLSLEAMLDLGMLPASFPSVVATVPPLPGPGSMKHQHPPKDQHAVNTSCSSQWSQIVPLSCHSSVHSLTTLLWSNGCYNILHHQPSTRALIDPSLACRDHPLNR